MYAWFRVSLKKYLKKNPHYSYVVVHLINRNIFNLVYFLSLYSLFTLDWHSSDNEKTERAPNRSNFRVPIEEEEEVVVLVVVVLVAVIIVVVV